MKKSKMSILLNIAMLCLSICAIAVGVYAAKSASITASGTVGFTVHNCHIKLTVKTYCASTTGADAVVNETTALETFVLELGANSNSGSGNNIVTTSNTGNISLTSLKFNDLVNGGDRIKVSMQVQNLSSYPVECSLNNFKVQISQSNTSSNSNIETNVTGAMTAVGTNFSLEKSGSASNSIKNVDFIMKSCDIDSNNNSGFLTISMNFEKKSALSVNNLQTAKEFEFLGNRVSLVLGNQEFVAVGRKNNSSGTFVNTNLDQKLPGTYYFMSYRIYNVTYTPKQTSGVYKNSEMREYLTSKDYLSFLGIDNTNTIYKSIKCREMTDVDCNDKFWLGSKDEFIGSSTITALFNNNNERIGKNGTSTNWYWLRDYSNGSNFWINGSGGLASGGTYTLYLQGIRTLFEIDII